MGRQERFFVISVALIAGCVHGLEPPKPTTLVEVPGGVFVFGSTEACFEEDRVTATCDDPYGMPKTYPTVLVKVEKFAIEEHEVTNEQYRYCVAMGKCDEPGAGNVPGFADDYYYSDAYKKYPVVNISQEMAKKYCAFIGRRLPTELEWELVAGGLTQNEGLKRKYPYETQTGNITDCRSKDIAMRYCSGQLQLKEVAGSADDFVIVNGKKVYDLVGNVAEWVDGRYKEYLTCKQEILSQNYGEECFDCFLCNTLQTDALRKECKETCYLEMSCPACANNANCFKQCVVEGTFPGIPRCISYGSEVLDQDSLVVRTGPEALAKGGAFIDDKNSTCRARVADRGRHLAVGAMSKFYFIGFRCAADL